MRNNSDTGAAQMVAVSIFSALPLMVMQTGCDSSSSQGKDAEENVLLDGCVDARDENDGSAGDDGGVEGLGRPGDPIAP